MVQSSAEKHLGEWHNVELGRYYFLEGTVPSTLVLGGLGDGLEALQHTVEALHVHGHDVAAMELFYKDDTEAAANETLSLAIPSAIRQINNLSEKEAEPIHLVGISKGGGEAILAAHLIGENSRLVGSVAVVSAVGPGNSSMGATAMERLRTFNKRRKIQQKALKIENDILFENEVTSGISALNGLKYALSRSDCPEIIEGIIRAGHKLFVVFANDDPIFRAEEGEAGLAGIVHKGLKVIRVDGDHACLARKLGQQQIKLAVDLVNS